LFAQERLFGVPSWRPVKTPALDRNANWLAVHNVDGPRLWGIGPLYHTHLPIIIR
jgi:hypothetical protein